MTNLILLNKPFQVMCQFTDSDARRTLAEFITQPGFYPAGRLDYDSEGLVLLTNNGRLQNQIADPTHKLAKTYWVQVEGEVSAQALDSIAVGVALKDGLTRPAKVKVIPPPELWPRTPPVRFRKSIPDQWMELTITEGKNRQVRRMTAAVGLPTLRLVRVAIGDWHIGTMQPGDQRFESVKVEGEAVKPKAFNSKKSNSKTYRGRRNNTI